MPPSLVALSGPLQGRPYEIRADGLAVGRLPANDLAIPDPLVSRHHCAIRQTGPGGWSLLDLGSRHGTFLNGRPVREAALHHGDLLAIGDSTFLWLEQATAREEPAADGDLALEAGTEIRLPVRAVDLDHLRGEDEPRTARALQGLLALASLQRSETDSADLGDRLLAALLDAVPAGRALLLLLEAGELLPAAWRDSSGAGRIFPFSRSLVEKALRDRVALLHSSAVPAVASASLATSGVRSAACVPLLAGEGALGALYVDVRDPGPGLEEGDLQVLAAAGVLAAAALADARRYQRLEAENRRLQESVLGRGMVGESPALRRVAEVLARAAPTHSTVLILGESGTGKELAARALHAASPRSRAPFVAINCASLSENLLESELFGHEKGAFTGALQRKIGKIEVAQGGTLFLDEIGEMPLPLQARLLRVLQERTFERVGGTRPLQADVRLVAATNRDLPREVAEGRFRSDLFYRLNVIAVTVPPLRERREDIPLLASHFASVHGRAVRGRGLGVSPAARALLGRYAWPGNIRELSNAIERAVVLGDGEAILPEDLPEALLEAAPAAGAPDGSAPRFHEALNRYKRQLIREAVAESGGTITRAAERLGLHPNHLHRLITSLDLRGEIE